MELRIAVSNYGQCPKSKHGIHKPEILWQAVFTFNPYLQISAINYKYL